VDWKSQVVQTRTPTHHTSNTLSSQLVKYLKKKGNRLRKALISFYKKGHTRKRGQATGKETRSSDNIQESEQRQQKKIRHKAGHHHLTKKEGSKNKSRPELFLRGSLKKKNNNN